MVYDLKDGRKMSIRRAEERDADEIVKMYAKMGGESDNLTFGIDDFYFTEEQERIFISNLNNRNNCLYIVAILDNKIIGNVSFVGSQRKKLEHRGDMGIAVLKDFWGIGVGKNLMEYFLKWASSNEIIKKIDLQVVENNTAAINFYMKYGFKIEGRITKGMYINGKYYDIYNMGKILE
ncbi:GNAT family N-acetyltransferase [Fonticella tunisiensis]|nr:GNAT family protein [Fonticella tunisiensis]